MDSNKLQTNLSSSSLVALKAELLNKKSQVEQTRSAGKLVIKRERRKEKTEKKNKGVAERSRRDEEEKTSGEPTVEKAKSILEAKARLYEKLASDRSLLDEDLESEDQAPFLVNFHQKVVEQVSSRSEEVLGSEEDYRAKNEEEEWVEYTDSLGRTRRCMKKDLPELQKQDREIKASHTPAESSETLPDLLSDDMRREMQRKQWERNELDNQQKRDLHYKDVLFEEARSHGVGFYAFSRDEEERARQMSELQQKRHETETLRVRKAQETAKKQRELQERLKKVRQRKRLRMGLPLLQEDEVAITQAEEIPLPAEQVPQAPAGEVVQPIPRPSVSRKVRPWDQGKLGVPSVKKPALSQRSWVEKQREERTAEFAPPSSYDSGKRHKESRPRNQAKTSRQSPPPLSLSEESIAAGLAFAKRQSSAQKDISFEVYSDEDGQSRTEDLPPGDDNFVPEISKPKPSFRRVGAEIPPPASMDYYSGNNAKRREKPKNKDLSESFKEGLANRERSMKF